jgi:hypothetical protein
MVSFYLYIVMSLTGYMGANPLVQQCAVALVGVVMLALIVNVGKVLVIITGKIITYYRRKKLSMETVRTKPES